MKGGWVMINKILYAARVAKGLTTQQTAQKLGMTAIQYEEIEAGISCVTVPLAEKLYELFSVSPEYFLAPEYNIEEVLNDGLKEQRDLLNAPQYNFGDSKSHLAIARMGIEAAVAIREKYILLLEVKYLENENQALRALYKGSKIKTNPRQVKHNSK
jgi:transcriptional regulator with XRE-family HTH domain